MFVVGEYLNVGYMCDNPQIPTRYPDRPGWWREGAGRPNDSLGASQPFTRERVLPRRSIYLPATRYVPR